VLLPASYTIWEFITKQLNKSFKPLNIQNTYFPLFITDKQLQTEKDHNAGFTPETATVTRVGNSTIESASNYLHIRPTSEAAIYSVIKGLIRSSKDLPIKFNQMVNVVRWEFKDCTPFIRSREFLWSESHHSFATHQEATDDVMTMITLYKNKVFGELLALPCIVGTKTNVEKFCGAVSTKTIECIIPNTGKGIQSATCHDLGLNFAKSFDVMYRNSNNILQYVYQTCHGITTRTIGIMIMTHADDKGLVLPPKVATTQVVIVVVSPKKESDKIIVDNYVKNVANALAAAKVRTRVDDDRAETMGFKCNKYEMEGIPIRLEIGLRDATGSTVVLFRRDKMTKQTVVLENIANVVNGVNSVLEDMHANMLACATTKVKNTVAFVSSEEQFELAIKNKKVCLVNWCETDVCEHNIKQNYSTKSLCIVDANEDDFVRGIIGNNEKTNCIFCSQAATAVCLFGKSY
jgi:prolyl-tRNA synthetase